jgi:hypothetical protein
MSEKKLNLAAIREILGNVLQKIHRYSLVLFLVFISVLYGVLVMQIGSLSNAQPSTQDIDKQIQSTQGPHIDKAVVKQIKSLGDNSVNVQSLFNEVRNNPFDDCSTKPTGC